MRTLSAAEAAALVAQLKQDPERRLGSVWSIEHLEACTDGTSVCLHRGAMFPDDWVREVWIAAPTGGWLAAARRFCAHMFTSGARQLRWRVAVPVEPRYEALWARYGARPIALAKNVFTVALDDPSLPRSGLMPWPGRVLLGAGMNLGPARVGELAQIAAWSQQPRFYEALGRTRGSTVEELASRLVQDDPRYQTRPRIHIYTVRRRAQPIGVIFEHQRDYDGDSVREIDMVLNDDTLPPRAWAQLLASIFDLCFRRGATRTFVNVRDEFPGMARIFGADEATPWSTERAIKRTHYTTTAAQFYASIAARRFLRHVIV